MPTIRLSDEAHEALVKASVKKETFSETVLRLTNHECDEEPNTTDREEQRE